MTREEFFQKFEVFAEAPGAVAKMRELILRLAASGRFADQKLGDQSGAELLEQIAKLRTDLIKQGVAKDRTEGKQIRAGDTIALPRSWSRCMISEVCDLQTGATPSRSEQSYFGGDIPWLVSGDINKGEITECDGRITSSGLRNSNCKIIPANSVLIALNGQGKTRATVALLRIPAALNQSLLALIPFSDRLLLPEYLFWNLRGRYFAIREVTGQDQRRGLNMGIVGQLSLPLPPVSEQRRIVAKVEELMALCDELEALQKEREEQKARVTRAALAKFSESPTLENLTLLSHPSYQISPSDLRKTILSLAVQGKLVPQDPKDEVIGYKQVGTETSGAPSGVRLTFPIPKSWIKVAVADVFDVVGGIQKTPQREPRLNAFPYVGVSNVHRGSLELSNVKRFELLPGELQKKRLEPGDLLVIEGNGSFSEIGRCAKWNGEIENCVHQNHVIRCRPFDKRVSDFVLMYLNSPHGTTVMQGLAITSSGLFSLSVGKIKMVALPLPPLAEQKRIVAKVEELMTLVDQLEAQEAESRRQAAHLLDALVADLTAA